MANQIHNASEEEARELAESSRETDWSGKSFLRNLFLGDFRADWIDPFPITPLSERYLAFEAKLRHFLETKVDSDKIDRTGEYGDDVLDGLRKMGAFGIKIDRQYGGLGFNQREYGKAMECVAGYDGSLVALLSAAQSIGLPQPLKLFGTPEQKKQWLPRCAAGAITAFALTEPDVGSDPARLATIATRTETGDFILNGKKLWITNGTIAEMMVVMARMGDTGKISAFIVDCASEGVAVERRCHFMGLKALANGVITFDDVRVPKENIIFKEGSGLKVALVTLNTGRLSLPVACVGGAKKTLTWLRDWTNERVQWGLPIGRHEAISHKLADMSSTIYAMDSWCDLAQELSMREGYDIRLEAATAKEWGSTRSWDMLDEVMQIRGGRGYETADSLKARGEKPFPVERTFRDARINRIFEGSSEIMHLFMAREMVDKHLQVAGALLDPKSSIGTKLKALPKVMSFYAGWYPKLWVGFHRWGAYSRFGTMAKHLRFVERSSRRLARNVFHAMVRYQIKMERKQAFLFRTVDIAMELAVMTATVVRTQAHLDARDEIAEHAAELTELHCRNATRFVNQRFRELWANDDDFKYQVGRHYMDGRFAFMEPPVSNLPVLEVEALSENPPTPLTDPTPTKEPAVAK